FQELVDLKKQKTGLSLNHSRPSVRGGQYPKVQEKVLETQDTLKRTLQDLNVSLLRLSERSMKSSAMTVKDYMQLLIDSELQQRTPGFQERLEVLNEAKLQAEEICGKDHFPDLRGQDEEMQKNRIVPMKELSRDDKHKIARFVLNNSCGPRDGFGQVLILVGASGSGKSTMVNGLVNFLMGVKWEDDRRYEIDMTSAVSGEESHASQTKWVTGYTIKSPEYGIMTIVDTPGFADTGGMDTDAFIPKQIRAFFKVNVSPEYGIMTIVDTPGFADTGGMDTDAFIPKQIRAFFKVNGMKELCGVGIVVPAAQSRLTPAEKYVYHSCLKMFGKDVTDNFYVIFTFSDPSEPPAIRAIKAEKIPYRDYFQVNNSALYSANTSKKDTNFTKLYWDMGVRGFGKLCTSLSRIKPVNLTLTTEVMAEQDALDDKVAELKIQLEKCEDLRFQELIDLQKQETAFSPGSNVWKSLTPKVQGKLLEARLTLKRILEDLNNSLLRLSERSMKSSAITVTNYVNFLIEAEQQHRRPGYRERLHVLNEAKEQAQVICSTLRPTSPVPEKKWISLRELSRDEKNKVARYVLNDFSGPPNDFGRVLILVGASGSGKSTMVNGLINFLLGVKWEGDRRYEIDMTPSISGEEGHASQTKWVTGYTIMSPEYGIFTIVDTPGFADTGGMDTDAFIPKQIRAFFKVNGMKELCGVGIVVPAAQARLTPAEKYVYHSCLKMFGKDVTDNFYVIFTFSDASEPPALEAIKAENIPYRDYFQVNNSALYSANKPKENTSFNKLYWDMGVRGFRNLCTDLSEIKPVSLALTTKVIAEQDALDDKVTELKRQLETCQDLHNFIMLYVFQLTGIMMCSYGWLVGFQELVGLQKQAMELSLNHTRPNVRRNLLPKLQEKRCEAQSALTNILKELNDSLLCLSERSMKSSAVTVMDYIQLLIDSELQERQSNYRERLQVLNEAKKLAEINCGTNRLGRAKYYSEPKNTKTKRSRPLFESHIRLDTDDKKGPVKATYFEEVPDQLGQKTSERRKGGFFNTLRNSFRGKKKRDAVRSRETEKYPTLETESKHGQATFHLVDTTDNERPVKVSDPNQRRQKTSERKKGGLLNTIRSSSRSKQKRDAIRSHETPQPQREKQSKKLFTWPKRKP
ncbi:unnamed protein product, partial [Darwinula stevensoni]